MTSILRAMIAIGLLAACATGDEAEPAPGSDDGAVLSMMLGGGEAADPETIAAVEARGPLGSRENPVRAAGPTGQRAYMRSLRCPDASVPEFGRNGSDGRSPYGAIVDVYGWSCPGGEEGVVYIDMYHPDHVERRAPEGQALRSVNEV